MPFRDPGQWPEEDALALLDDLILTSMRFGSQQGQGAGAVDHIKMLRRRAVYAMTGQLPPTQEDQQWLSGTTKTAD